MSASVERQRRYTMRIAYELEYEAADAQEALERGRAFRDVPEIDGAKVVASTAAHIAEIDAVATERASASDHSDPVVGEAGGSDE